MMCLWWTWAVATLDLAMATLGLATATFGLAMTNLGHLRSWPRSAWTTTTFDMDNLTCRRPRAGNVSPPCCLTKVSRSRWATSSFQPAPGQRRTASTRCGAGQQVPNSDGTKVPGAERGRQLPEPRLGNRASFLSYRGPQNST